MELAVQRPYEGLRHVDRALVPLAALLVAISLLGAGPRAVLVVAVPVLVLSALARLLPRGPAAAFAVLLGVLALPAGLIARDVVLVAGGALALVAGVRGAWGANRGKTRRRAWANRALALVGGFLALWLVVYPTLITVVYVAKPRSAVHESALGLPHERVSFPASDGVRLSGWYVPGRNGAAIVLVHGGGGDRDGAVRHARMLARAGYGVLLYDARGRGESDGHENAFGWRWDRDVRGAVDFLERRGIDRIGALGLSTGAEAVVAEAAGDPRVGAVVADGLQGRTASDASHFPTGDRITIQPGFAVIGAELRAARGEHAPPPLIGAVHRVARTRPLLLIGTEAFERGAQRSYARGTSARVWALPHTAHTRGLADHPREYRRNVLGVFAAL